MIFCSFQREETQERRDWRWVDVLSRGCEGAWRVEGDKSPGGWLGVGVRQQRSTINDLLFLESLGIIPERRPMVL